MSTEDSTNIPYGYCQCGCGDLAPIARRTSTRKGWTRGEPVKYLPYHHRLLKEELPNPNPSGMCMCGCGVPAPIATRNASRGDKVKGKPQRYIQGHQPRPGIGLRGPDYVEEERGHKTPCWIWQRGKRTTGYGYVSHGQTKSGKKELAHRVYYEKYKGPIPEGMSLDHLCRVTLCVNPAHLEPVTHAENCQRGAQAILSHATAVEIRRAWTGRYGDGPRLAKRYGVAIQTIYAVVYGTSWRD